MGIGESHALARQSIDVRRSDLCGSITTDVTVAKIISEDDNDVGR